MSAARPTRRRTGLAGLAALSVAAGVLPLAAGVVTPSTAVAATAPTSMPVYKVVKEGLTPDDGKVLADRAGIGNALRTDGSFSFTDPQRFADVPLRTVGEGRDESGNPTLSQALDVAALDDVTVPDDATAKALAARLLKPAKPYTTNVEIGHTTVDLADRDGKATRSVPLDTTVSYLLKLAGKPVVGPGAKLRLSVLGDGSVSQLTSATRALVQSDVVPIITPQQATTACSALLGAKVRQTVPTLAYYAPPLAAQRASGRGSAELVLPQYVCHPAGVAKDVVSGLSGRMVAAAPDYSPRLQLKASTDGRTMAADAAVEGGLAPYTYRWASSTTALDTTEQGSSLRYTVSRRASDAETLTLQVTDANGQVAVASVTPSPVPGGSGQASADGVAGGQGGAFSTVGIEQTVDEWQCAQDSAIGFGNVMRSHSHTVAFDWRGANAWEKDFKKSSLNGIDDSYVDAVDAQWYTGHGNPDEFTFKTAHDDTAITPSDASWGDNNLEWMQLESCQVLKDTNGTADYFGRWAPVFNGLHLLNGFDTNATCIGGGTGGRFASYLFPETFLWWTTRSPLTVQRAWASMADDLEPAGTRWRSVSPAGAGWVTNLGDHFWGQGSTGPDIPASGRIGFVSVSGVA